MRATVPVPRAPSESPAVKARKASRASSRAWPRSSATASATSARRRQTSSSWRSSSASLTTTGAGGVGSSAAVGACSTSPAASRSSIGIRQTAPPAPRCGPCSWSRTAPGNAPESSRRRIVRRSTPAAFAASVMVSNGRSLKAISPCKPQIEQVRATCRDPCPRPVEHPPQDRGKAYKRRPGSLAH